VIFESWSRFVARLRALQGAGLADWARRRRRTSLVLLALASVAGLALLAQSLSPRAQSGLTTGGLFEFTCYHEVAHQWFGAYFQCSGRFDDALRELKRAQELDPLSPIISVGVALEYLSKHDSNSAIEQCQRVIELDSSIHGAHHNLGFAYLQQHRYEEAIAELQKAVELSGRISLNLASLGYCYALAGKRAEALAIIKELEERHARGQATGLQLATVYAGLGDKDHAFAWLEKDFQQHTSGLLSVVWWLPLEDLHSDARYADLIRRMGLQ